MKLLGKGKGGSAPVSDVDYECNEYMEEWMNIHKGNMKRTGNIEMDNYKIIC